MSITSRINEMSSHIDQAYDELQGLGADLTNVNKNIENISMVLDDIYDSLPSVSGEGTSLTLDDTRVGKIKSTLKGNTSQESTTGINLAKVDYSFNQTTNGITCKVNSDGSISLSGTASANTTFIMSTGLGYPSGAYAMSCVGMPTNSDSIRIRFRNSNASYSDGDQTNTAEIVYNRNPRTITNRDINNFEVFVFSGVTLNSTIKVQLQTGSSATSFEPYTGGTPSPNPEFPQPVNVVSGDNEIVVCGKNLLENTFQSQTANGITFTRNEDGSLSFSGTATQAHSITGRFTNNLVLRAGTSYIFSLGDKQAGYGVYLQQTGNVNVYYLGVSATNSSLTITPTEDTTITQLAIHFPNGNSVNGTIYPMLEVGSSASTYKPYQGNTYNIDLGVENLWDTSKLQSGYLNQSGSYPITNSSYPNARYRLVYLYKGQSITTYKSTFYGDFRIRYIDVDTNLIVGTVAAGDNGGYCSSNVTYQGSFNNGTITALKDVILGLFDYSGGLAETTITYGTKIQTITPNPIELCKIGNYVDFPFHAINGNKYYDSLTQEQKDLLTYDKWYLHKEIGKVTYNGTEPFGYSDSGVSGIKMITKILNDMATGNYLNGFSNYFKNNMSGKNANTIRLGANDKSFYIYVNESDFASVDAWKTWLTTHNTDIYYPLATPTNTEVEYQPLIDQLNELEKAMSKDSQTNISQVNNDLPFIISASALKEWQESSSLNSTLSMVNPLSLGNTLNTQENNIQPIEVDNIEPLEEEENEES